VLKDLAPVIRDASFIGRIETGDPKIWILRYKAADGQCIIASWSAYQDDDWAITLKANSEINSKFIMSCPGEGQTERNFGAREWTSGKNAAFTGNLFCFSVRGSRTFSKEI